MSLNLTLQSGVDARRTSSPQLGTDAYVLNQTRQKQITDGTGANQANKIFTRRLTLAALASATYDLDSGSLSDPSGVSSGVLAAFSRIVALRVTRVDEGDENVSMAGDFVTTKFLGNAGSGSIADAYIPIRPGGNFQYEAPSSTGIAVTASTGDEITFENLSATDEVILDVVVIGS